jgi:hypothetical protein
MTNIRNDLDWVFKVGDVWATYDVKMTLATNLFNLVFEIKLHGMATQFKNFLFEANFLYVLISIQLVANFVLPCHFVSKLTIVGFIMLPTNWTHF